jgi:hypothetical protein
MAPSVLGQYYALFLMLWLGAIGLFLATVFRRRAALDADQSVLAWSSLLLSVFFFGLTVLNSVRASDQWKLFAVVFIASACTSLLPRQTEGEAPVLSGRVRSGVRLLITGAFVLMVWRCVSREGSALTAGALRPYRLRAAAEWLRDHTRPGEIVFHTDWDVFPDLFFWNQKNRYINGMDPIFLYAYNESLYWKLHHLASGQALRYTCGRPQCGVEALEETFTVLQRDFHASYLLVHKHRNANLHYYVTRDPRFVHLFEDAEAAVFRLQEDQTGRARE